MRTVDWSIGAQQDLDDIIDYVGADNPYVARRIRDRLKAAVDSLAFMPAARPGRIADTFEKPVTGLPYVIAFALPDRDTLRILRIIHASRNWPKGEWPDD